MPKENSQSLFDLVHAMNPSEKRHFRLESSPRESAYMRLFEGISKLQVWDEAALKAQFEGEAFLNQFSTLKNYLRNRILKSMRSYSEGVSPQAEVLDILRNIELLYRKGLYALCHSELKRAKRRVETFEMDVLGLAVLDWERKLRQVESPGTSVELEPLTNQQLLIAQRYLRKTKLFAANLRANLRASLEEGLPAPTPDSDLHERTLRAVYHYQHKIMTRQPQKAVEFLKEILEEWEANTTLRACYPETYVSLALSLVAYYIFTKDTSTGLHHLQLLRQVPGLLKKPSAPLLRSVFRAYNLELEVYRDQTDLDKGLLLAGEIESVLKTQNALVPKEYRFSFWYQFAYLHFLNRDFPCTLSWVNRLLNAPRGEVRGDLLTYAHWLNLIVHFELKNPFVLRYGIDGMSRFLKKRGKILTYEKALLRLLRKGLDVQGKSRRKLFLQTLEQLENEQIPNSALDYLNFLNWIKGHCQAGGKV